MSACIALDIDGVLADWLGWAHPHFCELLQIAELPFDRLVHYDPAESYGVTREQFEAARKQLSSSHDTARSLPLVEGAIDALKQLSSHFRLVLVTARHEPLHDPTRDWLAKHVEPITGPLEIYFTAAAGRVYAIELPSISKLDVCRQAGAICLVEDNPFEIGELDGSDVLPVCIGWPWNEHLIESHPHITRGDWPCVVRHLLDKFGAAG